MNKILDLWWHLTLTHVPKSSSVQGLSPYMHLLLFVCHPNRSLQTQEIVLTTITIFMVMLDLDLHQKGFPQNYTHSYRSLSTNIMYQVKCHPSRFMQTQDIVLTSFVWHVCWHLTSDYIWPWVMFRKFHQPLQGQLELPYLYSYCTNWSVIQIRSATRR